MKTWTQDDPHGSDCAIRVVPSAECTCGKADYLASVKPDGVIVEVLGGCVTEVHGVQNWILLDWDNLLGDMCSHGDTEAAWNQFDEQMQVWIQAVYPSEYKQIQERIAEDCKTFAIAVKQQNRRG